MHFITNGYKRFLQTNSTDPRQRVPLTILCLIQVNSFGVLEQTCQINFHCLRSSEYSHITDSSQFYLLCLLPPSVPKVPNGQHHHFMKDCKINIKSFVVYLTSGYDYPDKLLLVRSSSLHCFVKLISKELVWVMEVRHLSLTKKKSQTINVNILSLTGFSYFCTQAVREIIIYTRPIDMK